MELDHDLQRTGLLDYEMGVWEEEIANGKQIIVIWMFNTHLTYYSIDSMLVYLERRAIPAIGRYVGPSTKSRYLQTD